MERLRLWPEIAATWGAALGALYLHVALWALFAVLLVVFITYEVRSWKAQPAGRRGTPKPPEGGSR